MARRARTMARVGRTGGRRADGLLAAGALVLWAACSNAPAERTAAEGVGVEGAAVIEPARFLLVTAWTATYSADRSRQQSSNEGAFELTSSMTESGSGTLTLANPVAEPGTWWGNGRYTGHFSGEDTRTGRVNDQTVVTWTRKTSGSGGAQMGDDVDPGATLSIDVGSGTYNVHFSPPEVPGTFEAGCESADGDWEDERMGPLMRPLLTALCPPIAQGAASRAGVGGGISGLRLPATGLTLSGKATLWDGTVLTWTLVPEGEAPPSPFVDDCPPPPPPAFRIEPAAESPVLTPAGAAGRLGMDGARQLADDLAPDRHVCSPALTAGTAARLQEIQHHAIAGNHDVANSLYDALFVERDAARADWNKIRDLLGIAAGAGLVGLDAKPAVAAAARAVEEVAARELPDAGLEASLEIGAAAASFGLVELAERAKDQAAAIAEAAFMQIHETFDPCESNADDIRDFLNALAAWMLLDDVPPHYAEEAGEYVERVSTRLRTGSDPECAPRIVLVPVDWMHHQWRES